MGEKAKLDILGYSVPGVEVILHEDALEFVAALTAEFRPRLESLLAARAERQAAIDSGEMPDFLESTRRIRDSEWSVGDIPDDLKDRRVEITGPTDRKMIINALNSGAKVFMADCEDSLTPTWANVIQGQANLRDAVRGDIRLESNGKQYALNEETATLIVRPRGWHLPEKHLLFDGAPVPGAFVDFGLYLWHNAKQLKSNGTGPYFYLPKLESHQEARLWRDVFRFAEDRGVVGAGEIKVTVLVETILAAFEIDEILYELRDDIVAMNCGRWDYIFSFIKKFSRYPEFVLPDRGEVTMTRHFLRSYSQELIKTCHRRGAFAMGGMAPQIPIKNDTEANDAAMAKVRADKEREAGDGHDGTWVAHPGLVPIAMEVFDRMMPEANQLPRQRQDVHVTAADLLKVPEGTISEDGVRMNINVGIQYTEAWLRGNGCVPIYNLMEDAATAEISRSQLWQWRKHGAAITDGPEIEDGLLERLFEEEMEKIKELVGEENFSAGKYDEARDLFWDMTVSDEFQEFLTLPAYERLSADA